MDDRLELPRTYPGIRPQQMIGRKIMDKKNEEKPELHYTTLHCMHTVSRMQSISGVIISLLNERRILGADETNKQQAHKGWSDELEGWE